MTLNKYKGTVEFKLGDKAYVLNYNYEAIAEMISKFGKEILNNLYDSSPADLAEIIALGLKADGVKAKDIIDFSPPFFPSCKLVDQAIGFAYFGPEGPPKIEKPKDSKKKPG